MNSYNGGNGCNNGQGGGPVTAGADRGRPGSLEKQGLMLLLVAALVTLLCMTFL